VKDRDLMAKRKNLQLKRRAAVKQPDKKSEERRKYGPERQSIHEGQPSMYQSDLYFRERQSHLSTDLTAPAMIVARTLPCCISLESRRRDIIAEWLESHAVPCSKEPAWQLYSVNIPRWLEA
jgi:hypothetical protein